MSKDKSLATYIQSVEQQVVSIEQQLQLLRQHLSQLRFEISKEDRLRHHVTDNRAVVHEPPSNLGSQSRMPEKQLLRLKEVCHITGLSRSMIYKMMNADEFPRSIQISGRNIAWAKSEVDAWIERILGQGGRG